MTSSLGSSNTGSMDHINLARIFLLFGEAKEMLHLCESSIVASDWELIKEIEDLRKRMEEARSVL